MKNVTMSRVSNGSALRTSTVSGKCNGYPQVGQPFEVIGSPLDERASYRCVSTSIVKKIVNESDNIQLIETENSVYRLEF